MITNALQRFGLFVLCFAAAILFEAAVSEVLVNTSEWLYPNQATIIRSVGWAISLHPHGFGVILLPIVASVIYTFIQTKARIGK